ncbi:MAG: ABC transporter ATP-binding protein [Crenarchaeota archaeon]|nr:ABC transporter ATP-binding protein [Thermoproteota archaeon]
MRIVVSNLHVGYFDNIVLKDVNISFDVGMYFVLGPNGSGKSTLMRSIIGILRPVKGDVLVHGYSVFIYPDVKRYMGYFPHGIGLLPDLTVRDNFILYAELMGVRDKVEVNRRVRYVSEIFKIENLLLKKVSELSHGQRVRVGIARAFIHDPDILVFDEALAGLDPYFVLEIEKILAKESTRRTIIISTHSLSHVQACPHREIILISNGRIVFRGRLDELLSRFRPRRRFILKIEGSDIDVARILDRYSVGYVRSEDGWIVELSRSDINILDIVRDLANNGLLVREVNEDQDYAMCEILKKLESSG